eukprot:scaffold485342_cov33-Prasinocladus_malaysianus.AAC.1
MPPERPLACRRICSNIPACHIVIYRSGHTHVLQMLCGPPNRSPIGIHGQMEVSGRPLAKC